MGQRRPADPSADRLLLADGLLLRRNEPGNLGRRAVRAEVGVLLPHRVSAGMVHGVDMVLTDCFQVCSGLRSGVSG